jgi:hypothetical protein
MFLVGKSLQMVQPNRIIQLLGNQEILNPKLKFKQELNLILLILFSISRTIKAHQRTVKEA